MANDLNILLLGNSAVGKSSTGNSILGRHAFPSEPSLSSVTVKSRKEIARLSDGRIVRVVDTPGYNDTRYTGRAKKAMFEKALDEATAMHPEGYNVCVLTVKFGNRFYQEDLDTMLRLKKRFGDTFINTCCIVIMTCGDFFQSRKTDGEICESFLEWCRSQDGEFNQLLREVNERVILFNNFGDEEVQAAQRREFLNMVDETMSAERRVTNAEFRKALEKKSKLIAQPDQPFIPEDLQEETSLIIYEIARTRRLSSRAERASAFDRLAERVDSHLINLNRQRSATMGEVLIVFEEINSKVKDAVENERLYSKLGETQQKVGMLANAYDNLNDEYCRLRDDMNRKLTSRLLRAFMSPFRAFSNFICPAKNYVI